MERNIIPLTRLQKEIMMEFYSTEPTKVILNKKERTNIWKKATSRSEEIDFKYLKEKCPALVHQIEKSYENGKNIQSAVFSECVYAQTFANMLDLTMFVNCYDEHSFVPEQVKNLLKSYNLVPRYVYSTSDKRRMLIQAGGSDGIDSALITVIGLAIYTIEFKEPGAKTSEPDLPKYNEDGKLVITQDFSNNYPQFTEMLREHVDLNFFKVMGSNVNDFSMNSINIAVSNNYTKKFADVICTEDEKGYLVMIPANQVSFWAKMEGEIRPAGRNHYKVWTPNALKEFLIELGAYISGTKVTIDKTKLAIRKERGGDGKISGYKITPIFFVYVEDCAESGTFVSFDIGKVRQLNPTIAGKMFFNELDYDKVSSYYKTLF